MHPAAQLLEPREPNHGLEEAHLQPMSVLNAVRQDTGQQVLDTSISLAIRVNRWMKTVQITAHHPSILDLRRGEARHLVLEEEAPVVRGLSEGVRRM